MYKYFVPERLKWEGFEEFVNGVNVEIIYDDKGEYDEKKMESSEEEK